MKMRMLILKRKQICWRKRRSRRWRQKVAGEGMLSWSGGVFMQKQTEEVCYKPGPQESTLSSWSAADSTEREEVRGGRAWATQQNDTRAKPCYDSGRTTPSHGWRSGRTGVAQKQGNGTTRNSSERLLLGLHCVLLLTFGKLLSNLSVERTVVKA